LSCHEYVLFYGMIKKAFLPNLITLPMLNHCQYTAGFIDMHHQFAIPSLVIFSFQLIVNILSHSYYQVTKLCK